MPLNRPALTLGAGPRSVQDARRWVVSTLREIGRDDLVESAELAISEIVTNALLHGTPPIVVRVRGTREHPRIEVADQSTEAPTLPQPPTGDELEDLLTVGRGLSIVARASEAWGAEIEDDGKTVWCTPAAEFADDEGPTGLITGLLGGAPTGEVPVDPMRFRLLAVPVRDYTSFHNHFRELRREVRLLAMAHESDYPLASTLAEVFNQLGRPLTLATMREEVRRAQESDLPTVDLQVEMGREEARGVARFIELLDLTDAFAREEKMLSLARDPRQVAFQSWFLGEFVRQAEGLQPTPWRAPADREADAPVERRSSVS
ncbi:ATP-binding protein [Nocardioides sp. GXZ039]|uniref:ATP-binding protein n=1 Tax=Nocardioides sp. GXZ039 TaxID=3136018 RepID=UPI0030F4746D